MAGPESKFTPEPTPNLPQEGPLIVTVAQQPTQSLLWLLQGAQVEGATIIARKNIALSDEEKNRLSQVESARAHLIYELIARQKANSLDDSVQIFALVGKNERFHEFSQTAIQVLKVDDPAINTFTSLDKLKANSLIQTEDDTEQLLEGVQTIELGVVPFLKRSCWELRRASEVIKQEVIASRNTGDHTRLDQLNRLQVDLIIDRLIKPAYEEELPFGHSLEVVRRPNSKGVPVLDFNVHFPSTSFKYTVNTPENYRRDRETGKNLALAVKALGGLDQKVK